jgi:polo-like kinase 4
MANIPRGDIEMSFNSPITISAKSGQQQGKSPYMRIRFSRQSQFMELSQHLSNLQGEEWTKKSLPSVNSPPYISTNSWKTLEEKEKNAVQQLIHFVRTCEAVEGLLVLDEFPMSESQTPCTDSKLKPVTPELQTRPLKPNIAFSTPTIANTLSSVKLARRPPKLGTGSTARSVDEKHEDTSTPLDRYREAVCPVEGMRSTLDEIDLAEWCVNEFTDVSSRGVQTRFLPSVGWCIRYGSRVSQGGRYQIMFVDGVALDIDVDEDWVELRSKSRDPTRYLV